MILIFGGAYQGKLSYVKERFGYGDADIFICRTGDIDTCNGDCVINPQGKKAIYGIDKWILSLLSAGADVEREVVRFIDGNKDAVVVCDDISCGVVPVDALARGWREAVGKSMALLSRNSDEVVRLFCGIPTRLK